MTPRAFYRFTQAVWSVRVIEALKDPKTWLFAFFAACS